MNATGNSSTIDSKHTQNSARLHTHYVGDGKCVIGKRFGKLVDVAKGLQVLSF